MTENDFHRSILARPSEAVATWLVLADWLEERNDPRHELVRLQFDAGYRPDLSEPQRDAHIRDLIMNGMNPVAPRLSNSIGMIFTLIPPGRCQIGSPLSEPGRSHDEYLHAVEITRPYLMGVHPVTQQQFRTVRGFNPSHFKDLVTPSQEFERFPVDSVTWNQAAEFCADLSEREEEKRAGRS